MSAAILPAQFFAVDAIAIDDFEDLAVGDVESPMREVVGSGGAVIEEIILDQR